MKNLKKKKKMLLQAEQLTKWHLFSLKMTTSTILSEIDVILCICKLSTTCIFFSAGFEISHALNGTTFKIQQRKWGPKQNLISLLLRNKSMMISFSPQSW